MKHIAIILLVAAITVGGCASVERHQAVTNHSVTAPARERAVEAANARERADAEGLRREERRANAEAYGREQAELQDAGVRAYQERLCREHRFAGACAGVQP
jgi:hypothetical protein